jgi:ribosomal protein S18 acetylase RimI-like enzyme
MDIKEIEGLPDYAALLDLIKAEWPPEFGDATDEEKISQMIESHNLNTDTTKLLYEKSDIIGFSRYSLWPRDKKTSEAHIFDVAILPSLQKKGLGSLLMKDMISDCKNKEITKLLSRSFKNNPGSIKLHQKHNFTVSFRTDDSIVWELIP